MMKKPNLNLERDKEYSFEELASMECQNDYCYKEMLKQFRGMFREIEEHSLDIESYEGFFLSNAEFQTLQSRLKEA